MPCGEGAEPSRAFAKVQAGSGQEFCGKRLRPPQLRSRQQRTAASGQGDGLFAQLPVAQLRRWDWAGAAGDPAAEARIQGEFATQLLTHGAAVVRNVPTEEGEIIPAMDTDSEAEAIRRRRLDRFGANP